MTDKIYWYQLQNNPYSTQISLEQYYCKKSPEILMKCLAKGEQRGQGGTTRIVIFDKSYVLSWLVNKVFKQLRTVEIKTIFGILFKAFFQYCILIEAKAGLKVYKLHGYDVVRLEDLGIDINDLKEVSNDN